MKQAEQALADSSTSNLGDAGPDATTTEIGYTKFSVGDAFYVYDTTTNAIIRLPQLAWEILDRYLATATPQETSTQIERSDDTELAAAVAFLHRAKLRGMFQPFFLKDFSALLDDRRIETALSSELAALGLNLTDQCNQRCTYCAYSGLYSGERTHGSARMTWGTARRSIDYYLDRANQDKRPAINFYGGEPLLNWRVLRQCVLHIEQRAASRRPDVDIATNLTLLTREKLAFLVEHGVRLQVSLDGPAAIHDRARLFPNGKTTHSVVMSRLSQIAQSYPEYFRSSVSLVCTFNKHDDITNTAQYFSDHELLSLLPVKFGAIRESALDDITVAPEVRKRHDQLLHSLFTGYVDAMSPDQSDVYHRKMHGLFWSVFGELAERDLGIDSVLQNPNHACIPGAARLFVACDGRFYPCEKFSCGDDIGDCISGIDITKVKRLLKTFSEYCQDLCQRCWAYRLCNQCFVHAAEGGRLSLAAKRRSCAETKRLTRWALKRFVYAWENEPKALRESLSSLHGIVRSNSAAEARVRE